MLIKLSQENENGFTLIELMIVIAIIGILAAIAIPQFSAYRQRSFNSATMADIRNAATAQEGYYVGFNTYCATVDGLTGSTYGFYLSEGINMDIAASKSGYTLSGYHSSGNKTYTLIGPGGTIAGD
jgi:prepilin-type N-terminal cleavage/methylation domain-containing protein